MVGTKSECRRVVSRSTAAFECSSCSGRRSEEWIGDVKRTDLEMVPWVDVASAILSNLTQRFTVDAGMLLRVSQVVAWFYSPRAAIVEHGARRSPTDTSKGFWQPRPSLSALDVYNRSSVTPGVTLLSLILRSTAQCLPQHYI